MACYYINQIDYVLRITTTSSRKTGCMQIESSRNLINSRVFYCYIIAEDKYWWLSADISKLLLR